MNWNIQESIITTNGTIITEICVSVGPIKYNLVRVVHRSLSISSLVSSLDSSDWLFGTRMFSSADQCSNSSLWCSKAISDGNKLSHAEQLKWQHRQTISSHFFYISINKRIFCIINLLYCISGISSLAVN